MTSTLEATLILPSSFFRDRRRIHFACFPEDPRFYFGIEDPNPLRAWRYIRPYRNTASIDVYIDNHDETISIDINSLLKRIGLENQREKMFTEHVDKKKFHAFLLYYGMCFSIPQLNPSERKFLYEKIITHLNVPIPSPSILTGVQETNPGYPTVHFCEWRRIGYEFKKIERVWNFYNGRFYKKDGLSLVEYFAPFKTQNPSPEDLGPLLKNMANFSLTDPEKDYLLTIIFKTYYIYWETVVSTGKPVTFCPEHLSLAVTITRDGNIIAQNSSGYVQSLLNARLVDENGMETQNLDPSTSDCSAALASIETTTTKFKEKNSPSSFLSSLGRAMTHLFSSSNEG